MASGVSQILQDVEDLSLKAFIASRYASRQLRMNNKRASQLAGAEKHVASLEKEKAPLKKLLWPPAQRLRKMPKPPVKMPVRWRKPKLTPRR